MHYAPGHNVATHTARPLARCSQVLLPPLLPPLLTGTALAFSRALGEFGSIVIVSSNFAFKASGVRCAAGRELPRAPCPAWCAAPSGQLGAGMSADPRGWSHGSQDLIAPVLIFQCLEQYDFLGATVIGTVLLGASLVIMLLVNWIQRQVRPTTSCSCLWCMCCYVAP